jgi:hypothetical protein
VVIAPNVGYQPGEGDRLVYDVLIPRASTLNSGAVDFGNITGASSGSYLRNSDARDQFGLYSHPATDLSAAPHKPDGTPNFVRGRWMTRAIALTEQQGSTMDGMLVAFDEHDRIHGADQCPVDKRNPRVIAYFRNIRFVDKAGKTTRTLYTGEETLPNGTRKSTQASWLSDTVTGQAVEVVGDPNPQNQ